jgi:ribosomal protein L10
MANKEATVAELTDKFQSSAAVLLTEYRGLTVGQLKELRRSISANATYAAGWTNCNGICSRRHSRRGQGNA